MSQKSGKPTPPGPFPPAFRVGGLPTRKPLRFDVTLDAPGRRAMVEALGLSALPHLRLCGEIRPAGHGDFELEARLEARVIQPCVVTLAPVETRVANTVLRRYVEGMVWPEGEEAEMPEDDSAEPMPDRIDLREVTMEALALALPDYPRAAGADLGEAVFAPDETIPLRDSDLKPFAALSSLRDSLGAAAAHRGANPASGPAANDTTDDPTDDKAP
ncbi:MAG: YceD family protein [Pseudorhodobacter sp.]